MEVTDGSLVDVSRLATPKVELYLRLLNVDHSSVVGKTVVGTRVVSSIVNLSTLKTFCFDVVNGVVVSRLYSRRVEMVEGNRACNGCLVAVVVSNGVIVVNGFIVGS